jgi:ESS family glutamate:Na+ symporter
MLQLDPIQTLALAGVMLAVGTWLAHRVPLLRRYNIPAPIIGGLLIAGAQTIAYTQDITLFQFATKLRLPAPWSTDEKPAELALGEPFMQMFFASLGCGASIGLLRVGGPQVLRFFGLAVLLAVLQNVVGVAIAWIAGEPLLLGVLCGSVTLTGGPATGLAFEQQFTAAGLANVKEIALASGMGGIICGGIFGGPLGTWLEARRRRHTATKSKLSADAQTLHAMTPAGTMQDIVEEELDHDQPNPDNDPNDDWSADGLLRALVILLLAMGVGTWLSPWISRVAAWALNDDKLTLPSFIGAMFFAALLRNIDDVTGWFKMSQRMIDDFGNLALGLFIVLTIMDLRLWQLAGAAGPLIAILAAQIVLLLIACAVLVMPVMGRDYEAVVMSGGFFGFMMGTTANAMANMRVLVDRYGPAPRAFLVVPIVGAFLIDFSNGILITVCLNLFK